MTAAEFKARFLPHHKLLYRTAFRLLGNVHDAEDMVQEAYLNLWNRRDRLADIENVEAYLVTLVKNLCYDSLRLIHPDEDGPPPEQLPLAAETDVVWQVEQQDEVGRVKQLISRLPAKQQQVMRMRDVDDCSYQEIEQVTGLTAVNIRVLLSRARKKIREQFNALVNDEHR